MQYNIGNLIASFKFEAYSDDMIVTIDNTGYMWNAPVDLWVPRCMNLEGFQTMIIREVDDRYKCDFLDFLDEIAFEIARASGITMGYLWKCPAQDILMIYAHMK